MIRQLHRLSEADIEIVKTDMASHFVLARHGFVCLVEKTKSEPPAFGAVGSVCKLTSAGFAVVVWDGEQAHFASKGERHPALPEEIALVRSFAHDIETALAD